MCRDCAEGDNGRWVHGNYHEVNSSFFEGSRVEMKSERLRALVHKLNTEFSDYMRENG